jgi:hypothetical protein
MSESDVERDDAQVEPTADDTVGRQSADEAGDVEQSGAEARAAGDVERPADGGREAGDVERPAGGR